ncbi:hypothetical protein BGW37DRAFT_475727 [Umbelopsis sp. PMI_123]|nr:hypothetical protein BGW37DRAFT_475727 [Umbelopsis sp. PMI_123]
MPSPRDSDAYSDSEYTHTSEHYEALLKGFTSIMNLYDNHDSIRLQDWFDLIESQEQENGVSLLSEKQKQELAPFCAANADLELAPEDVVSLLKIAAQQRPMEASQGIFAHRRRTSKLLGTLEPRQRRRKESEQLGTLTSESDLESDALVPNQQAADSLYNKAEAQKSNTSLSQPDTMGLEAYDRQNEALTRRLMEREKELKRLEEEQEDRIAYISQQAQQLEKEIAARKKEIQDYKSREQQASLQIQELEAQVSQLEHEQTIQKRDQAITKAQLDEKADELIKLKDVVQSREAELANDHVERETTQKALQTLMHEKDNLLQEQQQLEQQLEESKEAFEQVYQIQNENETLKQTIEQMKLELDQLETANQFQIEVPKQQDSLLAELKTRALDDPESLDVTSFGLKNDQDKQQFISLRKQIVLQTALLEQFKSKLLALKAKVREGLSLSSLRSFL